MMSKHNTYTVGEELFNSITHGVGALLAAAAMMFMVVYAVLFSDGFGIGSAIVYGIALVLMYAMSTVYHIVTNARAKQILRIFDHCSIYILIAGTYTPYLLMSLRGTLGWVMFALIWATALFGIILNAISVERFKKISLICYICMGWAIVFTLKPIMQNVPTDGIVLLIAGGLAYTVGIIFYVLKKYRYTHSVWHLFVMAGSILQYFSILLYVL